MRKEGKKNKNKIVYKILSIIAVFLMIMGINIHHISAAENESYDYKYVDDYEFGDSRKAVIFQLKDESGEIYYAYCVDKDTRIQKNHDYSRVNVEDSDYYSESDAKQIRAIVRNSYPFQSLEYMQETFNIPTLTKGEAIDAIQFAIWNYANSYQGDLVNGSNENVKNLYNQLISLPAAEQITTIAEINFLEPSAIFNGESYDVDFAYKVTGKNVDGTTVSGDYSFEEDLVVQYGATIEEAGVDENGYTHIIVKNLPSKTTVNLTVNATQDLGRDVYFYDPEGGRNASQSLIGIHEGNTNISKSISFTTEAVSEIVIKKVDSDNNEKLLQGAEFTITSIDKGYTVTVVTDENGLALVKLPLGQYTIAETKAPEGYAIIEEVKTIDVTGEVTEATVFVFENKIKSSSNGTKKKNGITEEEEQFSQLEKYYDFVEAESRKFAPKRQTAYFILLPNYAYKDISKLEKYAKFSEYKIIRYKELHDFFESNTTHLPYYSDFIKALEYHSMEYINDLYFEMLERLLSAISLKK